MPEFFIANMKCAKVINNIFLTGGEIIDYRAVEIT